MFNVEKVVEELRGIAGRYAGLAGDQRWDHKVSYNAGVAAGIAFAAGRLEERLLQESAE